MRTFSPYRADSRYSARMATILFARMIRANPDTFGASCPLPLCVARTDPPPTPEARMKLIADARKNGMRVEEAWAHEATQIPVPGTKVRCLGDAPDVETLPSAPATQPQQEAA